MKWDDHTLLSLRFFTYDQRETTHERCSHRYCVTTSKTHAKARTLDITIKHIQRVAWNALIILPAGYGNRVNRSLVEKENKSEYRVLRSI